MSKETMHRSFVHSNNNGVLFYKFFLHILKNILDTLTIINRQKKEQYPTFFCLHKLKFERNQFTQK